MSCTKAGSVQYFTSTINVSSRTTKTATDLAKEILLNEEAQQVSYGDGYFLYERCFTSRIRQEDITIKFHLSLLPTETDGLAVRLAGSPSSSKTLLRFAAR